MSSIEPDVIRALVRQALEQKLGLRPTVAPAGRSGAPPSHPSQLGIGEGPECSDDIDLPIQKPCLIEPHRPCYHSGYCTKLGH
jgi:hypothetical protein